MRGEGGRERERGRAHQQFLEVLGVLSLHVGHVVSRWLQVVNDLHLVVLHLEPEPAHPHWSGCGSQLAGWRVDWLVSSWWLQNLKIMTILCYIISCASHMT